MWEHLSSSLALLAMKEFKGPLAQPANNIFLPYLLRDPLPVLTGLFRVFPETKTKITINGQSVFLFGATTNFLHNIKIEMLPVLWECFKEEGKGTNHFYSSF